MLFFSGQFFVFVVIFFGAGLCFVFAAGQLFGRVRYFENYVLCALLLCMSVILFQIGFITNEMVILYPHLLFFHVTFLYMVGPLAHFAYYLVILPVETLPRWKFLFFIPPIIALVPDLLYIVSPESTRIAMVKDFLAGYYDPWVLLTKLIIVGAALQVFIYLGYLVWQLLCTRVKGEQYILTILIFMSIAVTTSVSVIVTVGYMTSSKELLQLGAVIASLLMMATYFASRRFPRALQLLMLEAERKYYGRSLINSIDIDDTVEKMELMMGDGLYRDEGLTLRGLSDKLAITPHQLSQLLNERLKTNFNNYVNQYRIKEAKELLVDEPHKTVLAIALEVGFNSKSAFYEAFSRFTGVSPQSYRKEMTK